MVVIRASPDISADARYLLRVIHSNDMRSISDEVAFRNKCPGIYYYLFFHSGVSFFKKALMPFWASSARLFRAMVCLA